jgi:hypothetical protein
MREITVVEDQPTTGHQAAHNEPECGECIGSGGWFRYEPALEPSPGMRYLSCIQCRGTGRTASASA